MIVERAWAMPNKWTFKIKPISDLLGRYVDELGVGWANPFCGHSLMGNLRNDIDPTNAFATSHARAVDFLKSIPSESQEGVLFDPPYSPRQISECYKSLGLNPTMKDTQNQWTEEKNECARIIKPSGICISFGWNSAGLGKKRGFEIIELLVVNHGGAHNDTIVTVERKIKAPTITKGNMNE